MWSGIMCTPNYLLHLLKKSQTSVFHVTYQQSLCWEIKAEAAFFIFMPHFTITPSCPSDPLPSITVVFQGGQWECLDLEYHSNSNHTLGLIISGKSLCTMCYSGDQSSCVFTIPKHSVIWLSELHYWDRSFEILEQKQMQTLLKENLGLIPEGTPSCSISMIHWLPVVTL